MNRKLKRSQRIAIIAISLFLFLLSGAYIAARLVIPQAIEEQVNYLLGVPCEVRSAGINFLTATFWIKDVEIGNLPYAKSRDLLSVKKFSVNLSFTSFLARELIFEDIRLEEPVLHLERDKEGKLNLDEFQSRFHQRFKPRIKVGRQHFFNAYAIQRFAIKNGFLDYVYRDEERKQRHKIFQRVDFSFSDLAYPPPPGSPSATAFYFNAKMPGVREASFLVLGRGNFFVMNQNYKIKTDFKNIPIQDIRQLFEQSFWLENGFLEIHSEVTCRNQAITISNDASLRDVNISSLTALSDLKIAGFSRERVIELFNKIRGVPFEFHFNVEGDLNDPSFDLMSETQQAVTKAIEFEIKRLVEKFSNPTVKRSITKSPALEKADENQSPMDVMKRAFDKWRSPAEPQKKI